MTDLGKNYYDKDKNDRLLKKLGLCAFELDLVLEPGLFTAGFTLDCIKILVQLVSLFEIWVKSDYLNYVLVL